MDKVAVKWQFYTERSLVIFPFFKQCNPLKITLKNFEIDKKKFARLKFETIIYFTAEFDPILFFKHLNMIVICF